MAKSRQTYQKNENEKKRKQKQLEKAERREVRKSNSKKGMGFESMIAYVDHNGHLTDVKPDPKLRVEIKAEDIMLGTQTIVKETSSVIQVGRISIYDPNRKFGFIKDTLSQVKIFFHYSDVNYDFNIGDAVSFELVHGLKGTSAKNVIKHA